jgi:hypothetical protein
MGRAQSCFHSQSLQRKTRTVSIGVEFAYFTQFGSFHAVWCMCITTLYAQATQNGTGMCTRLLHAALISHPSWFPVLNGKSAVFPSSGLLPAHSTHTWRTPEWISAQAHQVG